MAELRRAVELALREDVGTGDRTTEWTVPDGRRIQATIVAKQEGVIAGTDLLRTVFKSLGGAVDVEVVAGDGTAVSVGQITARLGGDARTILTGERVALNFLQRLSGVASLTRAYVDAVAGTEARILDTRKTTPGLRTFERAAVRAGGGTNHRFGLFDMVLIKENHIRAAGGIEAAVAAVRRMNAEGLVVEVETTNIEEVARAATLPVDRILFDNMSLDELREAVRQVKSARSATETEASGGVGLGTVRDIAETGVDFISVGALTHSAPALDLSLLIEAAADGGGG